MKPRPRTLQERIHWLELGGGAPWLLRAAVLTALLVLTALMAFKRFEGAPSEAVLAQADIGRHWAAGRGYVTSVRYPQVTAWLERNQNAGPKEWHPDLFHAPLYPAALAAGFRLIPASLESRLFSALPRPPDGFGGDYVLLALNLILFWAAAGLAFCLAHALFGRRAAWLAVLGMFLSAGLWEQVLSVTGVPLSMALVLGALGVLLKLERGGESDGAGARLPIWYAALGALSGLLFLTDYTAGLIAPLAAAWVFHQPREGRRNWRGLGWLALGFLVVSGPWMARNLALSGSPIGLAWESVVLRAGDPTADPALRRGSLEFAPPTAEFRKIINKGLSGIEQNFAVRLWAGGAFFFTAFFIAGLLYRFRSGPANRVRDFFGLLWLLLLILPPFLQSGENERLPAYFLAPAVIVFGTGFFLVLVESGRAANLWRAAAAALLFLQALPLWQNLLEPRRSHFHYPPYFPSLLIYLDTEVFERFEPGYALMADTPAGTAWYTGRAVWAQPRRLADFQRLALRHDLGGLLLTPATLDRPFFSELAPPGQPEGGLEWSHVYAGLASGRLPPRFPLSSQQRFGDNLVLLLNPLALPPSRR